MNESQDVCAWQTVKGRILTCVYCGMEYPQDTPAWGDKVLTDHIKVCEKHPLRAAEGEIKELRGLLKAYMRHVMAEESVTYVEEGYDRPDWMPEEIWQKLTEISKEIEAEWKDG